MEGVGSRLGRASSRYGPATTVFNGPVRKWKKKWVHVSSSQSSSSSSSSTVSYHNNSHSQSNGQNNNIINSSRLLLCRWTPLSSTTTAENGGGAAHVEEPPKRKFRYTPIAVLEQKKKTGAKKVEEEAKASEKNQFTMWSTSKSDEMNIEKVLKIESPDSSASHLDLGLCLNGQDDHDSGQSKEGQSKGASSGGYWTMVDTQHPL